MPQKAGREIYPKAQILKFRERKRSLADSLQMGPGKRFLTAAAFHQLGGFPDLPMMEDFELVRRLRPLGRIAIAPRAVVTSDRRWRSLGILRTTLANQAMVVGYFSKRVRHMDPST